MKKKKIIYSLAVATLLANTADHLIPVQANTETTETPAAGVETNEHTVTLKVKTDGVESNAGGSLISEDGVLSGKQGTKVSLKATPNSGYRFVRYESYLENGNSTDGLLPIENDSFEISDKTGSVTVYAVFETIPVDPNVYFSDDFSSDTLSSYQLSDNVADKVSVSNGRLEVHAPGVSSITPLLAQAIEETSTTGYEVAFDLQQIGDVKPWNTFRLVFKEQGDGSVYALEFTGKAAFIKKLASLDAPNQAGDKLAEVGFELGNALHRLKLVVKGDTVSVTNNDAPVLSYTSEDNWGGAQAKVAFTPVSNRSVALDNLEIRKTKALRPARVVMRVDGKEVEGVQPGVVKGLGSQVFVGDPLDVSVTAKPGYDFKGFTDADGTLLDLKTYRVGEGEAELVLYADFVVAEAVNREAKVFYIDSQAGNDDNNGETQESAWKSLEKLRETTLVPGDQVLLKRGSRFVGEGAALNFKGSGTKEDPILISAYGEGERPLLEAQGKVENVVTLYNQEYITIESLAITNLDPDFNTSFELNGNNNRTKILRGMHIVAEDFGVVHDITIRDMHIHDINGSLASKWNGGIFFNVNGRTVPTKYDGVLIENNHLERVDRSGIKLVSSTWANQNLKNNKNLPLNWLPSTNVVVRGNRIDRAGGDSITVRDTDAALVEYNISSDARYQNTGYNAGIWPFQATNTVLQYNEAFRTHGVQDGQGLDLDHVSSNSVMQYNYSHDNEGGFMLIMNWYEQTSPTVRYNISQNDKDKTFELARGGAAGTAIYNNTIYSDSKLTNRAGVIDMPNAAGGTGVRDIFFFNNIFYFAEGEKMFAEVSDAPQYKDKIHFYNNAYVGVDVPEDPKAITEEVTLKAIGTGPTENKTMIANAGKYLTGQLDGYTLPEDSVLATKGVSKEDAIAYFYEKLGVSQQVDFLAQGSATMAPTEAFALNQSTNSVDAIARAYPVIPGVQYDTDFFGRALTGSLSIGAAQGQGATEEGSEVSTSPSETLPSSSSQNEENSSATGTSNSSQTMSSTTPSSSLSQPSSQPSTSQTGGSEGVSATKTLASNGVQVTLSGKDVERVASITAQAQVLSNLPTSSSLHSPYTLYDIELWNASGEKVQLEGTATVRMPIQQGKKPAKVLYVLAAEDTYAEEALPYRETDGFVTFETSHFSQYAVVYQTGSQAGLSQTPSSSSAGQSQTRASQGGENQTGATDVAESQESDLVAGQGSTPQAGSKTVKPSGSQKTLPATGQVSAPLWTVVGGALLGLLGALKVVKTKRSK